MRLMPEHIRLKTASLADVDEFKKIKVLAKQIKYSGHGEELAKHLEKNDRQVYLIFLKKIPVGCFYLLFENKKFKEFLPPQPYAMLLGLSIDKAHQNKGIALVAMQKLIDDFKINYADLLLVLSVNCNNIPAQRLYQKVGFIDAGKLYYGGKAGPQHVYYINTKNS